MNTYEESISYLFDHLPYFQRKGAAAYKGSLDNTLALDLLYEKPHQHYKTIHIAGTNGKGSVSHMLASVLQSAGLKTGLYTSPHLKDFRERIRVNGQMVREQYVIDFVNDFLLKNETAHLEPSFFELTVMMAFDYFALEKVDVAIVEVGLGGRLDSTNVIVPELSVITNISMDHMNLLGDSLGKIALEKAGIIKKQIPVIIGESHPQTSQIFSGIAEEVRAPVIFADQQLHVDYSMVTTEQYQSFNIKKGDKIVYENLLLDLLGNYQSKNIITLLVVIEQLRQLGWYISDDALRDGLIRVKEMTGLMGRWQILGSNPRIICDTGHNEAGIKEVVSQINRIPYQQLHVVIGFVNDKDITKILPLFPSDAIYYFTKAAIPRALNEKELSNIASFFNLKGNSYETVDAAFVAAKTNAGKNDLIFIGGSTFVVAEVLP